MKLLFMAFVFGLLSGMLIMVAYMPRPTQAVQETNELRLVARLDHDMGAYTSIHEFRPRANIVCYASGQAISCMKDQ